MTTSFRLWYMRTSRRGLLGSEIMPTTISIHLMEEYLSVTLHHLRASSVSLVSHRQVQFSVSEDSGEIIACLASANQVMSEQTIDVLLIGANAFIQLTPNWLSCYQCDRSRLYWCIRVNVLESIKVLS